MFAGRKMCSPCCLASQGKISAMALSIICPVDLFQKQEVQVGPNETSLQLSCGVSSIEKLELKYFQYWRC